MFVEEGLVDRKGSWVQCIPVEPSGRLATRCGSHCIFPPYGKWKN